MYAELAMTKLFIGASDGDVELPQAVAADMDIKRNEKTLVNELEVGFKYILDAQITSSLNYFCEGI